MASLKFLPSADSTVVSERSREIIRSVLNRAGLSSCVITSTVRSPARQARAMYNNIEATSAQTQLALYGTAGNEVIHEYQRLKPLGHGRQAIIDAMEQRITELGPARVSRHCADPSALNVVDIAPSSISDHSGFLSALEEAKQAGVVSKFFAPINGDPAFHLEIPQFSEHTGGDA